MYYLVITDSGVFSPSALHIKKIPIIFFQGGIHAGEIEGKDAGFLYLKEILESKFNNEILKKIALVFVPVFNIDGHEKFSKNNRPNQNGPEEMGWRTTSQNLNLNRDYTKAEAPEMQAMIKLLNKWNPIVYLDLHTTDGAKFQHQISVMITPSHTLQDPLTDQGKKLSDQLLKDLAIYKPLNFYPSFIKDEDPSSGFEYHIAPPRFSNSYWALHNRIGILVETHSWAPYETRVKSTRDVLKIVSLEAAIHGKEWIKASYETEKYYLTKNQSKIALSFEPSENKKTIDFLGYAYQEVESVVTGNKIIQYDDTKPEIWKVPLYDELKPSFNANIAKGYYIPPEFSDWIIKKLNIHGIKYVTLKKEIKGITVESFQVSDFEFGKNSFEGKTTLKVKGEWKKTKQTLSPKTIFVPLDQPLIRLILYLFEPLSSDSFLAWGFFNSFFERKEYIENYVLEPWAKEALIKETYISDSFKKALEIQDFKNDEEKRNDFFSDLHPSHDNQYKSYPILKAY